MNKLMRYGVSQKKLALIRKNHGTYEDFGENDWTLSMIWKYMNTS